MDFQQARKQPYSSNSTNTNSHSRTQEQRRSFINRKNINQFSSSHNPEAKTKLEIENFTKNHKTPLISESTHLFAYTAYGMYANLWHSDNLPIINQTFLTVKSINNYKKEVKAHNIKYSAINESMNKAYDFIATMSKHHKNILIVGLRKYIRDYVKDEASRAKIFYVTERWLGGMLTNLLTVRKQIRVMTDIKKAEISGVLLKLSKNEIAKAKKKYKKLKQTFGGILTMNSLPDCVVVLCPRESKNVIKEAKILKIPTVALINTGDSPRDIDYPIFCNNFYKRSYYLFTTLICDAVLEGEGKKSPLRFAYRDQIHPDEFRSINEIKAAQLKAEDELIRKREKERNKENMEQTGNSFQSILGKFPDS